jgi:cysteine-rich repeat protein
MRRHPPTLPIALALAALAATASAKRTPCPPGRYVITQGAAIIIGDTAPAVGTVVVQPGQIALGTHCGLRHGSIKATKKGTKLKGQWASCGALRALRLSALIENDCQTMVGTVRAKKTPPQSFRAELSRCGDAIVDTGGGEACDSTGCAPGERCTGTCTCEPVPTTTITTATTTTTTTTTLGAFCGDGIVEPGEECDDGNDVPGDGCTNCRLDRVTCPASGRVQVMLQLMPTKDGTTQATITGLKVELAYPSAVTLPGSGILPVGDPMDPATRIVLLDQSLYTGLTVFNDTDTSLDTTIAPASPVSLTAPLSFERITFDCTSGVPLRPTDFACTVPDESGPLGVFVPPDQRPACELSLAAGG